MTATQFRRRDLLASELDGFPPEVRPGVPTAEGPPTAIPASAGEVVSSHA